MRVFIRISQLWRIDFQIVWEKIPAVQQLRYFGSRRVREQIFVRKTGRVFLPFCRK